MGAQEPTQDPQDKAFGAAASRDQEFVDELEEEGRHDGRTSRRTGRRRVPDPRERQNRRPPQGATTGEDQAKRNRAEEPPA